jgi:hypothetical protein
MAASQLDADLLIAERYLHEVKRWFCITNLKLSEETGVDILTYDSRNKNFYQIELSTSSRFPLRVKSTMTLDGKSHKNGLDFFLREKFDREMIISYLQRLFGTSEYRKVILVLDIYPQDREAVKEAAKKMKIEIWLMRDLILALSEIEAENSSDDILRIIKLCKSALKRY